MKIQDKKFARLMSKASMILILKRYIEFIETGVVKKYNYNHHDINNLKKILEEIELGKHDDIFNA